MSVNVKVTNLSRGRGKRRARHPAPVPIDPSLLPHAAQCLEAWRRDGGDMIPKEELARITHKALRTVQRWTCGTGEPDLRSIALLEEHRPGLLLRLFPKDAKPWKADLP